MDTIIRSLDVLVPTLREVAVQCKGLLVRYGMPLDFYETGRTFERQQVLVQQGFSKTLASKHLAGEAFDLVYRGPLPEGTRGWAWVDSTYWKKKGFAWFSDYLEAMNRATAHLLAGHFPVLMSAGLTWKWTDWPHYELRK